jgi:protein-export membrane protein SecD
MLDFPTWKKILVGIICSVALFLALPNFLPKDWMEDNARVNLGLDLRGGSYLLLEVDFNTYLKEQLQSIVEEARGVLRKERIGYRGLGVRSGQVSLSLRDLTQKDKAEELLRGISRDLIVGIDDSGQIALSYREQAVKTMQKNVINQSIEIVRRRVDETGTREPIIQRQGNSRILLQVPGLQDPEQLKRLLGQTAKMTFHLMDPNNPFPVEKIAPPPGTELLKGDEAEDPTGKNYYLIKKRVVLSGDLLVDSRATFNNGRPVVSFRFNNIGGRKFADITRNNTGKPFAIVLDGKVVSAPYIDEPILGGSGIIRGQFTAQKVQDLSLLLRAGALPAPLNIIEERTVGPSLGQDSINAGIKASALGVVLVILFMFLYYGLFGVFANIALMINMVLIIACLSLFQATLTLPGIAGIILTMGMAVDSNVLIFERIKEEIDVGRTPYAAIDHGFGQAFKTIIDSNITTLIATFLLFAYGSGPVKGFAVTLSIGIICSMFSAILLTRVMVITWLHKKKPSKLPI